MTDSIAGSDIVIGHVPSVGNHCELDQCRLKFALEEALAQAERERGDELCRNFDDSEWSKIGLGNMLIGESSDQEY